MFCVGIAHMAVVTRDFDDQDTQWVEGCVEVHSGQAVKLLDDSDPQMWQISVNGQEGRVPQSHLLSTQSGRTGAWGSAEA
jgi:hypothetical protein